MKGCVTSRFSEICAADDDGPTRHRHISCTCPYRHVIQALTTVRPWAEDTMNLCASALHGLNKWTEQQSRERAERWMNVNLRAMVDVRQWAECGGSAIVLSPK